MRHAACGALSGPLKSRRSIDSSSSRSRCCCGAGGGGGANCVSAPWARCLASLSAAAVAGAASPTLAPYSLRSAATRPSSSLAGASVEACRTIVASTSASAGSRSLDVDAPPAVAPMAAARLSSSSSADHDFGACVVVRSKSRRGEARAVGRAAPRLQTMQPDELLKVARSGAGADGQDSGGSDHGLGALASLPSAPFSTAPSKMRVPWSYLRAGVGGWAKRSASWRACVAFAPEAHPLWVASELASSCGLLAERADDF